MDYEQADERVIWSGDDGPGAYRQPGLAAGRSSGRSGRSRPAADACVASDGRFHWLRANVCVDFQYERGEALTNPDVSSPSRAAEVVNEIFAIDRRGNEMMGVLALNTKNRVLGALEVTRGGARACLVDVAAMMQPVLLLGAPTMVMFHNHPSGDPTPSEEDLRSTKAVNSAAVLVGVKLLDHIIVAPGGAYFSFANEWEL